MKLVIQYCELCGGRGQAVDVAAEVKKYLQVDSDLVDVGKGKLDVLCEGEVIFSKDKEGRFPRPGEIVRLLREKNSGARS